jgi:hypothetical protein
MGLLGRMEKGRGGKRKKGFLFFKKTLFKSFSYFQTSIKQETMHSIHDAQTLIISNFIQVIFKYFKSQFYLII